MRPYAGRFHRCAALVGAVIDRPQIPSPGGRVDFSYRRRRDEKDGRGMAKCWTQEEAWYSVLIVRLPPAFLIRHGWRRATFPPGEGIGCAALVGASIARPPCLPRFEGGCRALHCHIFRQLPGDGELFCAISLNVVVFPHIYILHLVFRQILSSKYAIILPVQGTGVSQRQWRRPPRLPALPPGFALPVPRVARRQPPMPGVRHPLRRHRR